MDCISNKFTITRPIDHLRNLILDLWEKTLLIDYNENNNELVFAYSHILETIIKNIKNIQCSKCPDIILHSEFIYLFNDVLCFTAYVRDIHSGLGHRKLFYAFLVKLYKIYPQIACNFFKNIYTNSKTMSIGCWRDIPQLCFFIQDASHPFIDFIVQFMNETLYHDYIEYKKNGKTITNCAKWIPRERKNKNWLFEKFALQWSKKYFPYLLPSPKKCFMKYRKIVSNLSKTLLSIEQKLCTKENIDSSMISQTAMVKNWYSLFDQNHLLEKRQHNNIMNSMYRNSCSTIISYNIQNGILNHSLCYENRKFSYIKNMIHFPDCISNYVSFAFRCISITYSFVDDFPKCDKLVNEIKNLNALWKKSFEKWIANIFIPNNTLPVIHIHVTSIFEPALHRAIAHACFLSQLCNTNRILFCAHNPIWINIENAVDFMSKMRVIYNTLVNELLINTNIDPNLLIVDNIDLFHPMIIHHNGSCSVYNKKNTYNSFSEISKCDKYKAIQDDFFLFMDNEFNTNQ